MAGRIYFVYITTKDADEARTIGRTLVQERLAACANIIERIESFYWWDGAVQQGTEAVLIAKSKEQLLSRLIDRVRALHSYTCPCIEAIAVADGNPDYLRWIETETGE